MNSKLIKIYFSWTDEDFFFTTPKQARKFLKKICKKSNYTINKKKKLKAFLKNYKNAGHYDSVDLIVDVNVDDIMWVSDIDVTVLICGNRGLI